MWSLNIKLSAADNEHPKSLNLYFSPKYLNISRWIFSLKRKMVILTSHIFLTTGQLYSILIGRLLLNTGTSLAVRGKQEYFIKLYFKMFTFTNNFYFLHKVSSLPSVTLRRLNCPNNRERLLYKKYVYKYNCHDITMRVTYSKSSLLRRHFPA